jgi:hypothetical protein
MSDEKKNFCVAFVVQSVSSDASKEWWFRRQKKFAADGGETSDIPGEHLTQTRWYNFG